MAVDKKLFWFTGDDMVLVEFGAEDAKRMAQQLKRKLIYAPTKAEAKRLFGKFEAGKIKLQEKEIGGVKLKVIMANEALSALAQKLGALGGAAGKGKSSEKQRIASQNNGLIPKRPRQQ